MADIIRAPPPPSSFISCISPGSNDGPPAQQTLLINCNFANLYRRHRAGEEEHLSVLALFVAIFRKPSPAAASEVMEIGWPSNVRHVAHVTFDRFDGFLGLPVEFEPEVPRRPPSASTRVFGVSTESMQLSFDSRGNCVPTILLMMQRCLYSQGGLRFEGIFRINPANGHEEYARKQLNNGLILDNIDVHCIAGLIKAWFRELPTGLLDSLSSEEVMAAQSEDECIRLLKLLPPTESSLMDWVINLMADVAELEHLNKMNAHNIAMVFAPNMTQMLDPLTALMYAVQVMNFLKTLIVKTLREREDPIGEAGPQTHLEALNEEHPQNDNILKPINTEGDYDQEKIGVVEEPQSNKAENKTCDETRSFPSSTDDILRDGKGHLADNSPAGTIASNSRGSAKTTQSIIGRITIRRRSHSNSAKKGSRKHSPRPAVESRETIRDIIVNSPSRGEAWR